MAVQARNLNPEAIRRPHQADPCAALKQLANLAEHLCLTAPILLGDVHLLGQPVGEAGPLGTGCKVRVEGTLGVNEASQPASLEGCHRPRVLKDEGWPEEAPCIIDPFRKLKAPLWQHQVAVEDCHDPLQPPPVLDGVSPMRGRPIPRLAHRPKPQFGTYPVKDLGVLLDQLEEEAPLQQLLGRLQKDLGRGPHPCGGVRLPIGWRGLLERDLA